MSDEIATLEEPGPDSKAELSESLDRSEAPASNIALSGVRGEELDRLVGAMNKTAPGPNSSPDSLRRNYDTWTARDLIELAKKSPPKPIIQGLLNEGDILLLHGTEESFKSVFVVQCAEAIATGTPF